MAALVLAGAAPAARAHHVGAYTPKDNEISQNFKQIKFALQARKLDVATRLYADGAVRREMKTRAATLPPGLEAATHAALRAGDVPRAEAGLATVFAVLARELAVEADRTVADTAAAPDARLAAANRFLDAIWRYWNLIDFVASQRDPKASVAMRLAFDEADTLAKVAPPRPATDPARLRAPLGRIAQTLSAVVQSLETVTRRES
jgi:hypothetical protein